MKTFKRTLSLVLAVCMLASMAIVASVSVAAVEASENGTRPIISDVINSDPEVQVETNRYYFYMPDNWYNDKNDNYDGESLESCAAGIYWWEGSYLPSENKGDNANEWPGYRVLDQDENDPHIFYCDVPVDASTIIFNNTVDGGQDDTNPNFGFNSQTSNIKVTYNEDDDPYGFYPTLDTAANMIYVCNPTDTEINDFSGAITSKGDWFYYYQDGTYGTTPEKGDAYFANGDFPSALQISTTGTVLYVNEEKSIDIYTNAPVDELDVETSAEAVTTVGEVVASDDAKWASKVTITGIADGDAVITFKQTTIDPETGDEKEAYRTAAITVAYARPRITIANKTLTVGKTASIGKVQYSLKTTYKSNKTSVATVDSKGKVTAKAEGKATITVTATAGTYTVTEKATITVKKAASKFKVTAKGVTASSKKATTIAAKKYAVLKNAAGKVTYKKASGDKKITVAKDGKMTVKKGLKKGKYTVKVKVTDAGSKKVAGATKTIAVKVTVK